MKTYDYKGYDSNGKIHKGLMEAMNLKDAREKAAATGVLVETITETGAKADFSAESRSMVYRELAVLLKSGMPLMKALESMINVPETGQSRIVLAGIRDRIREGKSLADSFRESSDEVSLFEHSVIKAAEKTATLDAMLERLASFLEEEQRLRGRVSSALVYPSIVVGIALVLTVVMFGVMMPRVLQFFEGREDDIPLITSIMMKVGGYIVYIIPSAVVLVLAAVWFITWRCRTYEQFRRDWDRFLFKVPVIGTGYVMLVNLRFARTLEVLTKGGISITEAVKLAGSATGNAWIAWMAESAAEEIRHGEKLADCIRRIKPFAGLLPHWIQIGESSGNMEDVLKFTGDRFQDRWDRYVNRCLSQLEPILIIAVALLVLLVVLSVLLPIIDMSSAIAR